MFVKETFDIDVALNERMLHLVKTENKTLDELINEALEIYLKKFKKKDANDDK